MRKIAVLTSGGDAPGMNAAIRSVVRTAIYHGMEVIGIRHGYNGLIRNEITPLTLGSVADVIQRGGTILYTARSDEFRTKDGQNKAAETLRQHGVDGLVVIGGDGSFRGAQELSKHGFSVVGIPGTIDNDIPCCDETIGYDTAVNTAIDAIDKIRDTATSHDRTYVVEVMGRRAGDIALQVGLAGGAESILIPEHPFRPEQIVERLERGLARGKRHSIIVVAEGAVSGIEIGRYVSQHIGVEVRVTVLGHIQRGGAPSARDRILASKLGEAAVLQLISGASGKMVAPWKGVIHAVDFDTVFTTPREPDHSLYELANVLAI